MKKATFFIFICFIGTLILVPASPAADKTKALLAIEQAKSNLDNLIKKRTDSKEYQDDIITAQNYLKVAEGEYKKNIGLLGGLKDEAEPTVRHYAAMADITVAIVTARLDTADQIREKEVIEKNIQAIRARIKVFEDKNTEIERLKTETGSTKVSLSGQVGALKTENAALKAEIASLNQSKGDLLSENKKIKDDLNGIKSQKGVEFVQVQSRLASATKAKEFLTDLSKLGLVARISAEGATIVIPRSTFFKTGKKGLELTAGAEKIAGGIAAVAAKNPEYRLDVKVFGYGKPPKNEDIKATDAMAGKLKSMLVEKGKMNTANLDASGAGTTPVLFPNDMGDANRRVEFTFIYKTPAK
jgi:hypothetical protein